MLPDDFFDEIDRICRQNGKSDSHGRLLETSVSMPIEYRAAVERYYPHLRIIAGTSVMMVCHWSA